METLGIGKAENERKSGKLVLFCYSLDFRFPQFLGVDHFQMTTKEISECVHVL